MSDVSDWPTVLLKHLQAPKKYALNGGPFGSKLVRRDYTPSGIPVIRGKNLSCDSRFNLEDLAFVSEEKADELLPNNAHPGDLVFTQRGTLGQVGIIPKCCGYNRFVISQSQMKLTVDQTKADSYFLYYYFRTSETVHTIQSLAISSGVPHINLDILRHFKIQLPPLPTQRKIAAVLSAYDDLIENNTRRIALLEQTAQILYREWFVHFRFPGHESVPLVESELGPIPEGWKITAISEAADVFRGRSYRSANLVKEGSLPFLNLKCIKRDGGFRYDGLKRYAGKYKDTQKAKPGDIIVAVTDMTQERRIVARAARVPDIGEEPFVFSMDLVKVVPKENVPLNYLYGMLRFSHFPDAVKQYASGVNVLHLRPSSIAEFEFALAPRKLRERYAVLVSAIYKQCDILQKKNGILRCARDLLLPRLISGQLDVSELEILTGEFGQ
ncbi:MAG: restriction endonuclease subunit S [Chloroflexota bacterium]|nr:restriction endonuclease subunit S [Chloroflexota bacterium]